MKPIAFLLISRELLWLIISQTLLAFCFIVVCLIVVSEGTPLFDGILWFYRIVLEQVIGFTQGSATSPNCFR